MGEVFRGGDAVKEQPYAEPVVAALTSSQSRARHGFPKPISEGAGAQYGATEWKQLQREEQRTTLLAMCTNIRQHTNINVYHHE